MTGRPSTLTLVVVDDDEHIRCAVGRLLRSLGHTVHAFESAEAYLAGSCQADCAILDIDLPGISGLELEEQLRRQGRPMAVVFVTAHDEREFLETVRDTRWPYLKKPLDEHGLLDAIRRATSDQG